MTGSQQSRVLDMTALKGLAHPLRVRLLEALSTYGPATASRLADRLGESSGATSYHLRQLEKSGFVREDATRGSGRERWWERVPGAISVNAMDYAPETAERAASDLVLAEWQRARERLLRDFLSRGDAVLERRWLEASLIDTANLRLTAEQLRELGERVASVISEFVDQYRGQKGAGVRPVQIQFNAFPPVEGVESKSLPPRSGGSGARYPEGASTATSPDAGS